MPAPGSPTTAQTLADTARVRTAGHHLNVAAHRINITNAEPPIRSTRAVAGPRSAYERAPRDWSTTTAANENITTAMPTNCHSDTSSSRNAHAISVLVTGMASVIVEPSHAGMRARDQFISM